MFLRLVAFIIRWHPGCDVSLLTFLREAEAAADRVNAKLDAANAKAQALLDKMKEIEDKTKEPVVTGLTVKVNEPTPR